MLIAIVTLPLFLINMHGGAINGDAVDTVDTFAGSLQEVSATPACAEIVGRSYPHVRLCAVALRLAR